MTNIIKPHHQFKIEFLDVPEFKRTLKGVYRIENFYVGASKNIRGRILAHCFNAERQKGSRSDTDLLKAIRGSFNEKGFLCVTILDTNPMNEFMYIDTETMYNSRLGRFYHEIKKHHNLFK
jgi:hypothetical protein